jgi:fructose/tagatose bisphosphate aldolase
MPVADYHIHEAIDYGVVKMNLDTDLQWAFWDGVRGFYCYTAVGYPGAESLNNGDGLFMVADRETHFGTEE